MTSSISSEEKVRENRLRRMAKRQGLVLKKSPRRDPQALDYGRYWLVGAPGDYAVDGFASLDELERYLETPRENR